MIISDRHRRFLANAMSIAALLVMTLPAPWPYFSLWYLVTFYGGLILDRLPRSSPANAPPVRSHSYETPDDRLWIYIDGMDEEAFEIGCFEDWQAGRSFNLYGQVVCNDEPDKIREPNRRGYVTIIPENEWPNSSFIGHVGGGSIIVRLPHRITNDLLQEFRRNLDQIVILDLKTSTRKDGEKYQGVCRFSMVAFQRD